LRIFHPFAEMQFGRILSVKVCMTNPLADVINRAKFYLNPVRDFDSVRGRIFGFPIWKRSRR